MSARGRGGGGRGGRGGGRGEYYRNKYGGGGRGGGGRGGRSNGSDAPSSRSGGPGGSFNDLTELLRRIDGNQYPAYHALETAATAGWNHPAGFSLQVGRTQSDPFAPPTRCRVTVPLAVSHLSAVLYSNATRRMAAADYLMRQLYKNCRAMGADNTLNNGGGGGGRGGGGWSGPKGGDIQVMEPTQHVMEQSAVWIDATGTITAQVTVNLPARGRTILAAAALHIFDCVLVQLVQDTLVHERLDQAALLRHVDSVEDQVWLQNQLQGAGLVAFVANGAILPRLSGADDRPMLQGAIPFESPDSLQASFSLPNAGTTVTGMGIRKGVTLICGGGFHGKSTLLQTLQLGVYSKVPGDGREFCVTSPNAAKIRAEDGRCVKSVDISPFINNLPFGKDTTCFSTSDASGSTSQAANIVEAIEMGADTLLVDEDTCATNFMIRDNKMAQLVASEKEPITPFVRIVGSIYKERSISTILVIGGAGDYFDVADYVLLMDCYKCEDATERAKAIVAESRQSSTTNVVSELAPFGTIRPRYPVTSKLGTDEKVRVRRKGIISFGETELDLSGMEQIVSQPQTNAISAAMQKFASLQPVATWTLYEALTALDQAVTTGGLEVLAPGQFNGAMTRPRLLEIAGAINRLREDGSIEQR